MVGLWRARLIQNPVGAKELISWEYWLLHKNEHHPLSSSHLKLQCNAMAVHCMQLCGVFQLEWNSCIDERGRVIGQSRLSRLHCTLSMYCLLCTEMHTVITGFFR
jgi:hypothetical protein